MEKEYNSWRHMKQRCYNPKSKYYAHYGGRGISICDRWKESFCNFLLDMGRAPSPKHSIERIDNNSNYAPENCKWATQKEQSQNTRRNEYVAINGETKCVSEWCRIYNISTSCVSQRIHRSGWDYVRAITTPAAPFDKPLTYKGQTRSVAEWSRICGFSKTIIKNRLSSGWSIEKALSTPPGKYTRK